MAGLELEEDDLVEQVSEFQISLKTSEEIEKLTVNENLNDEERCFHLLSDKAQLLQRLSVIKFIPLLTKEHGSSFFERIFVRIQVILGQDDPTGDMHGTIAEALLQVLEGRLLSRQAVAGPVLTSSLRMLDARQEEIICLWLEVIFAIIQQLPRESLSTVMDVAVSKSDMTRNIHSRLVACQLFGALAPRMDSHSIMDGFLSQALALCQDTNYDVRVRMCEQLGALARAVGMDCLKRDVLPELVILLEDEEPLVRTAAVQIAVGLLDFVPRELARRDVIPRLVAMCKASLPDTQSIMAECLGQFMHTVYTDLSPEEVTLLLVFFKETSSSPEDDLRRFCAFNLPAVVKCLGPQGYSNDLCDIHTRFSRDASAAVRKATAASLHEVVRMLGPPLAIRMCKDLLVRFLREPSLDVLALFLAHLDDTLRGFMLPSVEQKEQFMTSVIPHIIGCYNAIAPKYQMATTMIGQFENFTDYFTSDQIFHKFSPILFDALLANMAAPVKMEACRILCVFVRRINRTHHRNALCVRIVSDLARGPSYWHRMMFMEIAVLVNKRFSRGFFKSNFFEAFLDVAQDRVSNVRFKACSLLPMLKKMLKLPLDAHLLKKLEEVLVLLQSDRHREVAAEAKRVAAACAQIVLVPVVRAGLSPQFEDDLIDQKKEEEENAMLRLEAIELEEERKREDDARGDFRKQLQRQSEIGGKTKPAAGAAAKKTAVGRTSRVDSYPGPSKSSGTLAGKAAPGATPISKKTAGATPVTKAAAGPKTTTAGASSKSMTGYKSAPQLGVVGTAGAPAQPKAGTGTGSSTVAAGAKRTSVAPLAVGGGAGDRSSVTGPSRTVTGGASAASGNGKAPSGAGGDRSGDRTSAAAKKYAHVKSRTDTGAPRKPAATSSARK